MDEGRNALFRGLGPQGRRRLALAAVFAFYAAYIGMGIYWNNLFTAIGTDYLAFWSAGYLANTGGYARAYDIEAIRRVQVPIVPQPEDPSLVFTPLPALILPAFVPLFQPLALLPARWSLLAWTVINLFGLLMYWRFFTQRLGWELGIHRWLPFSLMFSIPIWWTLVWGQTNILLLICVGEFLRLAMAQKPFRAGCWLAGLLLKPQTLVLIVPALFLQRSWKTLAGFIAVAFLVAVASLALGGTDAFRGLLDLWQKSAYGMPTNNPQVMVNWRMVGINLSPLVGPGVGWGIALLGLSLTILAAISLWLRPLPPHSPKFVAALLGTLAATCAVTWHSHLHMMSILIPPTGVLLHQRRIPPSLIDLWLFLPPGLTFLGFILDLVGKFRVLPLIPAEGLMATQQISAFTGWGMGLCLFLWAFRTLHRWQGD